LIKKNRKWLNLKNETPTAVGARGG